MHDFRKYKFLLWESESLLQRAFIVEFDDESESDRTARAGIVEQNRPNMHLSSGRPSSTMFMCDILHIHILHIFYRTM